MLLFLCSCWKRVVVIFFSIYFHNINYCNFLNVVYGQSKEVDLFEFIFIMKKIAEMGKSELMLQMGDDWLGASSGLIIRASEPPKPS